MERVLVSFPEVDVATGNRLASDLTASLRDELPDVEVESVREDPATQDFGATVAILAGSAAAKAIASGVGRWIERHHEAKLRLRKERADGSAIEVEIDGWIGARAHDMTREFLDET